MIRKAVIVMVVLAILVSTAQAGRMDTSDGMTAGGILYNMAFKVVHNFQLDCDINSGQKLAVSWDNNKFQLDALTSPPDCSIPGTFIGSGVGTLNGVSGATIWFSFTDNGDPGSGDYGEILIVDAYDSALGLGVSSPLEAGNYKWR